MQFVRRTEWGVPAASGAAAIGSTRGVKVHYLGTPYTSRSHSQCGAYVKQIRASHLANTTENYADIAYNLLVCEHGYVFEGRGAHRRTGANGNQTLNTQHYAVCALLGSSGLTEPTDAMLHGLRDAIEYLRAEGGAGPEILGHRDGYATSCPGGPLYAWVKRGAPRPGGQAPGGGTPGAGTYTVVSGDTLSGIGARLGIAWQDIAAVNGITAPYVIQPKQVLRLPRPKVSLSRLIAAAKADPPKAGTPVSYDGVKVVEDALVAEGLLDRSLADGHMGTASIAAYREWQIRCGFSGKDADGIPGEESLGRLAAKHGFEVVA